MSIYNQHRWILLQSLPCGLFEFVEDLSVITSEFIMGYDIESDIDYILMIDVE